MLSGHLDDAELLLGALEQAGPAPPYRPSVRRGTNIMSNLDACVALSRADLARGRGDTQREADFAALALARSEEADELLRAMARSLLGEIDWLQIAG